MIPAKVFIKTTVLATLVIASALPAQAYVDGQCQTKAQARVALTNMRFRDVKSQPHLDRGPYAYFTAQTKTGPGQRFNWLVVYDRCNWEIAEQIQQ